METSPAANQLLKQSTEPLLPPPHLCTLHTSTWIKMSWAVFKNVKRKVEKNGKGKTHFVLAHNTRTPFVCARAAGKWWLKLAVQQLMIRGSAGNESAVWQQKKINKYLNADEVRLGRVSQVSYYLFIYSFEFWQFVRIQNEGKTECTCCVHTPGRTNRAW